MKKSVNSRAMNAIRIGFRTLILKTFIARNIVVKPIVCCTIISGLLGSFLQASTTQAVFEKYPNKYFLETGTFYGDGIDNALRAGFQEVYSIEIAPHYYHKAVEKFKNQPNVHLILGDSATSIPECIQNIDVPITFWLDGHYSEGNTGRGSSNSPILQELDCIKSHPIKTHTILIDDARLFGTEAFDHVSTFQIIKKLQEINPDYEIKYEHGYLLHDVLVAYPPK